MGMKQLSGLDATFLYLEKPEMPMHVGAMHLLELPAGHRGRYGVGKERPKGRTVKRDFANNVNQKMSFKVNFPTSCSHSAHR